MPEQHEPQPAGSHGDQRDAILPRPVVSPAASFAVHSSDDNHFGHQLGNDDQPPRTLSLAIILRQKWWILGTFFVVVAVTVPCIWLLITPRYRATALVRVAPVISRIVFKSEEQSVPLYRSFLNTQVSTIRSPTILQRVLDQEEVRQTSWYREKPTLLAGGPASLTGIFGDALSAKPLKNTELIEVSMIAKFPADAKVIVDAVVNEFRKHSEETLREADIRRSEALTNERRTLQAAIKGLVATKFNISKAVGTLELEELRSQKATYLNDLESEYQSLSRKHAITQWQLDSLISSENEEHEQGDSDVAEANLDDADQRFAFDPEWRKLRIALRKTRHQLELARQKYGVLHPDIKDLMSEVKLAKELLAERQVQIDKQWVELPRQFAPSPEMQLGIRDRAALQRVAQKQQRELELLKNVIERQRAKVAEAGEIAQDIAGYDEEIRNKRELYATMRSRLKELELEGKAPGRISVASYAEVPLSPYRDRRKRLLVVALGAAMMIGLGVGYLRSRMNPKICEADDVQHTIRVPFLGQLPALPATTDPTLHADPILLEGIRMVRTSLLGRLHSSDKRVVLLTSSSVQAGKSTVAVLLAQSLANMGKKVLLIEADLRRPTLSGRMLGFESKIGLAAVLAGVAMDTKAILPTKIPNLDLLVAGAQPEDFNFELLANGHFSECLSRWKKKYDLILLDSPPVLSFADTRILASQTDGTIMILRSSHCRRADVVRAYADLSAAGATLLGTVLVDVRYGLFYHDDHIYQADRSPSRLLEAQS